MSSKKLYISILIGLTMAFAGLNLQAQDDFEDFGEDEFSEVELDDTDFSDEDFDEVEFDDEEEFAEEDFDNIEDADDLEDSPSEEGFAEEEFVEEELEAVEEDPIAEEPIEEDPIAEPISEDLTPPAVAEEDLFSNPTPQADEPDYDYEAELHAIYNKFHKEKTSEEDWQNVVGERITELYTIQKNDKLWEISRTLFGDGNYWPKVWSLNSRIRNPHLIKPRNQIQFVLGDESGPPAFTISEEEPEEESVSAVTAEAPQDVEKVDTEESEENEPEIPPPLITSKPVVKRLPPSLPKWQVLGEQGEFDELGIDYGIRKITQLENKIPLAAYVSERNPDPIGVIKEVEAGSQIASSLQYVYVEIDSGTAQIGDTVLVIRNMGEVEKAHESVSGFLGYSIEIQGELQLVERIPRKAELKKRRRRRRGRVDTNRELYRAIVSKLVNPVSVGSELITGRVEYIEISEKGPRSQVVAQIVGGQYFNKRQVYGAESVAYVNRGSNDGLSVGEVLSVRENRTIRNRKTLVRTNVRPIGWVRVVKVEPNLATVVVVSAWSDIMTGDITGSGSFVPREGETDMLNVGTETASRTLLQELDGLPSSSSSEDDEDDGEFDEEDDGEFDESQFD